MDHFMEEIVVKKDKMFNEVLYVLSMIMMVISGILAVMMLNFLFTGFDIVTLVLTLISAGMAVLLFLRRDRLRTEYEYTFTNGELDFAMVFNNQKRKTLGTMKVQNVEAFGPVTGDAFKRYVSMKDVKTNNWFLNRGAELYFFYFAKDGKKKLIIIEPSQDLVVMIKKYLSRGVYQG